MSNLTRPYEISIWEDIWENGKYVEKRLAVIGSDQMDMQCRAISPTLTRNANGSKKFSFQMYKRYVDIDTGKEVENPYCGLLINERKVKLRYGKNEDGTDRWYDFVVKNIDENSSSYLYTYQLEDAFVQELSKNGFGIILDAKLQNNVGTAGDLASSVLSETDWTVESEAFVQTIEDSLVYITIPAGTNCKHIIDQQKDENGIYSSGVTIEDYAFEERAVVLACYSSCKDKPHRFQFIYSDKGYAKNDDGTYTIVRNDNRVITEKDCQYYIDFDNPTEDYVQTSKDDGYNFWLPNGFLVGDVPEGDSTVSGWFRAKRYGFAQQSVYVPLLDRYCKKYLCLEMVEDKEEEVEYLGYEESEYASPTVIQNYITGYKFDSTGGWTATSTSNSASSNKPEITNIYGRFDSNEFITIVDDFLSGAYSEANSYAPYMRMDFKSSGQFVLNSCIKDNRTVIKNIPIGEEWVLDYTILNDSGAATESFTFSLGEYVYNVQTGGYNERAGGIAFSQEKDETSVRPDDVSGRIIFTASSTSYTEDSFKKDSKIFLRINPSATGVYYIKKLALYRKVIGNDGKIIVPDYEEETSEAAADYIDKSKLVTKYYYFESSLVSPNNANAITEKEKLPTICLPELSYSVYRPVYNEGAQKVRAVTVKESNYFNIIQSIAETFEAWTDIVVERDDDGSIKSKKVKLKNYSGKDNNACFRYGVNLKDIQRTFDSKKIVTKLMVKQNANKLAKNGFCTIQRAAANPTGESYIYDFQYLQNMGIMDVDDYLDTAYKFNNSKGPDSILHEGYVEQSSLDETTLNGYFPRLKKINEAMLPITEELIGLNADLVQAKAKLEVAEATYDAAISGIEETRESFYQLTKVYPENLQKDFYKAEIYKITPKDSRFTVEEPIVSSESPKTIFNGNLLEITFKLGNYQSIEYSSSVSEGIDPGALNEKVLRIKKEDTYGGIIIAPNSKLGWQTNTKYSLSFIVQPVAGAMMNIGGHKSIFNDNEYTITVKDLNGNTIPGFYQGDGIYKFANKAPLDVKYLVTFEGTTKSSFKDIIDQRWWIQPNGGINQAVNCIVSNISLSIWNDGGAESTGNDQVIEFTVEAGVWPEPDSDSPIKRVFEFSTTLPAGKEEVLSTHRIDAVDITRDDVQEYLTQYTTFYEQKGSSFADKIKYDELVASKESFIAEKEAYLAELREWKKKLNFLFYQKYSRFIQEGTWISEEYVDDDKYYTDALSVMYNSCYPQVQYSINVLALSMLPGYELLTFDVGDKTRTIDPQFFGEGYQEEVVITEMTEVIDDASKDTIKVQNFKNQFQDLFQKITATVQQTQYNSGYYEKGAALTEATAAEKSKFITDAINSAQSYLSLNQTVVQDSSGITITDDSDATNRLRLVGGAILFATKDPRTEDWTWRTGLTKDGISADLITAGRLDAGTVQIMAGNDPVFRWDAYGISAYDFIQEDVSGSDIVTGVNSKKFVRFDKHGIYGINQYIVGTYTDEEGKEQYAYLDGSSWHPTDKTGETAEQEINKYATFALTWEGLKVAADNAIALIGNHSWTEVEGENTTTKNSIIRVQKGEENTFVIDSDGNVSLKGNINATGGEVGGWSITGSALVGRGENSRTITLNNSYISFRDPNESKHGLKMGFDKDGPYFAFEYYKNGSFERRGEIYSQQGYLLLTNVIRILPRVYSSSVTTQLGQAGKEWKELYVYKIITPENKSGILSGTWTGTVSPATNSDQNLKHEIELLSTEYSDFFDALTPRRFKYNDGSSNRYHLGFIAQEIQQSLIEAGIPESEFAGIITLTDTDQETGEQTSRMALRYEEFISLNTWQIQLLKKRVSELESKIEQLLQQ